MSNTSSNIKVGQYYQYEKRLLCGFDTSFPIMRGFEMHTKLPTESWNFYEYITKVLQFQMESLTLCPVKKCKSLDLKIKVGNSREVKEVVEGTTSISDKKLSEIC